MAKNLKKTKETTTPEASPTTPGIDSSNGVGNSASVKPAAAKKARAKSTGSVKGGAKTRGALPRKSATGRKRRPKTPDPSPGSGRAAITEQEIRTRAYFISEWRMQNGIAGDSANDWLEARRQLWEEAAKPR
jgi:hypothetical protein